MADALQSMVGPCPIHKDLRNDLTNGAILVRLAERVTSRNKLKSVLLIVTKSHINVLPKGGGDPRIIPLEYVTEVMVTQKKVPQMLFRVANPDIADLIISFTNDKKNLEPSASIGNFLHVFQRLMQIQYQRQIQPKAVEGSLYQRSNIERLGSTSSKLNFKQAIQQQKHSQPLAQPPPPPPPPPPVEPPVVPQSQKSEKIDFSGKDLPVKTKAPSSVVSSSVSSSKHSHAKPTFNEIARPPPPQSSPSSSFSSSHIPAAEKAKMSLSRGYSKTSASSSSSEERPKFAKEGKWAHCYHKATQLSVVVLGGNRIGLGSPPACFYLSKAEKNGMAIQDELGRYWGPTVDGKQITLFDKYRKDVIWLHDNHGVLWETSVRSAAFLSESPGPGTLFTMKAGRVTEDENISLQFVPCDPPRHVVQKIINEKQVAYNNEAKLATETLTANRNHLDLLSEQQLKFLNIHNNQLAGQTELLNSAKQLQELQRQQDEFRRKQQEMLRLQQQENNRMLNETIQGLQQLEVAQQRRHNELSVERDRLIAEKEEMIKDTTLNSSKEDDRYTHSECTRDHTIPHTHSDILTTHDSISLSEQKPQKSDRTAHQNDKIQALQTGFTSFLKKHDKKRVKEAPVLAKKAIGREEAAYRELLVRYKNCPVKDADFLREEDQISSIKNEVRELRALLEEGGSSKRSVKKGHIDSRYLIELPVGKSTRQSQYSVKASQQQPNNHLLSPLAPNGDSYSNHNNTTNVGNGYPQSTWTRQPHQGYYPSNSNHYTGYDYRYSDR